MATTEAFPELPLFDLRVEEQDLQAVAETLRSGWLTLGPRTAAFEEAFAAQLGARHAIALSSCTAALHLAYLAAGVGPGDEVIVPSFTFAATANAVLYCGATPVFAEIVSLENPSLDPEDVERRITPRTKAVCVVHYRGLCRRGRPLARAVRRAWDRADRGCRPRAERDTGRAQARHLGPRRRLQLLLQQGPLGGRGRAAVHRRRRGRRVRALTPLARDDERYVGPSQGRTDTYDVLGLGFNYRLDEPRAALLLSRLERLEADIARRRELTRRYRTLLAQVRGLIVPFEDDEVEGSSCYVMPIMLDHDGSQAEVSASLRERGIQTSIFYPSIHRFTAYRERFPDLSLPLTELASRTELTLPLYPHMTDDDQDRVVNALAEAIVR